MAVRVPEANEKAQLKLSWAFVVRMKGLEPPRLAALDPKSSVSTNSTTSAERSANIHNTLNIQIEIELSFMRLDSYF